MDRKVSAEKRTKNKDRAGLRALVLRILSARRAREAQETSAPAASEPQPPVEWLMRMMS